MSNNWHNEIRDYWGEKNLRRLRSATLQGWALSEESKKFMTETGVVRSSARLKNGLGIAFDLIGKQLQTLDALCSCTNGSEWLAIGHCFESLLAMSLEDGRICLFEFDNTTAICDWHLNASLEQLMYCITKALQFFDWARSTQESSPSLEKLRIDLEKIDPQAFESPSRWWPQMLHEIEFGIS